MLISMNETWKQIKDSIYYVSSLGRVATTWKRNKNGQEISFDCNGNHMNGYIKKPRINIKPTKRHSGYLSVELSIEGKKSKNLYVHRLVCKAFIPNPNNLPTVNHKDGNHLNNKVSNLEWMSYRDNNLHAYKNGLIKRGHRNGSVVACYTLDGTLIDTYQSMREAERVNHMANGAVSQAIKHGWNYNGFFWSKDNSLLPEQVEYLIAQNEEEHKANSTTGGKIKVDKYDLDGNYIATYNSLTDAAKKIGGEGNSISRVVSGNRKTYKGFIWKKHN